MKLREPVPGEFSAACVPDLRRYGEALKRKGYRVPSGHVADMSLTMKAATKFALPDGGRFYRDGLKDAPNPFRLPFPNVVLEYEQLRCLPDDSRPDVARAMRRVILASEVADSDIRGGNIRGIEDRDGRVVLLSAAFFLEAERVWVPTPGALFLWRSTKPADLSLPIDLYPGTRDEGKRRILNAGQAFVPWDAPGVNKTHAFDDINEEAIVLLMFMEILGCSNVRTEKRTADAFQNSKRTARGLQPFFDYHVLTIPGESGHASPGIGGGTHASPRCHVRRGHPRWIRERSERIWVNKCVVGSPESGFVMKDYAVRPETGT